jgi:hypothetical protein
MCLATVATVASLAMTAVSAVGTIMGGSAANDAAKFEAKQMEQQAGQERAASQRVALEKRRESRLVNSRVTAVAAGSGAGATDPTVIDLLGENEAAGEYNALSSLYEGEEKARGLEMGASARRYEGKVAKQSAMLKGGATLLGGAAGSMGSGSLFDKYGQGGMPSVGGDYSQTIGGIQHYG